MKKMGLLILEIFRPYRTVDNAGFFFTGILLGYSSIYVFSLMGFCKFDISLSSYVLAIASIIIAFFIYYVSTNQTDKIETQTTEIKKQTQQLKEVSDNILKLNRELNTAILGQAKGFEQLFGKIYEILIYVNNQGSKMRLVLPIPTLGFFNKQVHNNYSKYKDVLIEICKSNKDIELVFLNPFKDTENNDVLKFFKSIIKISSKNGYESYYENSYKRNVIELLSFLTRIIRECSWKENIRLIFIDDLFLSGVIAANGGYKSSLFFFIGPELLNNVDENKNENPQKYLSTAVYNNTEESYDLINNLIDIQNKKSKSTVLFQKISQDLFCCFMNQLIKDIENEYSDCPSCVDPIFKKYYHKMDDLSIQYYKIEKSHFYFKDNSKPKNILILPSAAGIYSHFNKGDNRNLPRFDMFYDIMNKLECNCYLFSFSGQGLVENGGEFSAQKGKQDLKKLSQFLSEKNITINCVLGFCVGNQIYFDFCKENQDSCLNNIPLIMWDLCAEVHWDTYKWFQRAFPHIKLNTSDLSKTLEPINSLPETYEKKMLYCYPHDTYNNRKYKPMIEQLKKIAKNFLCFEYQNLNHIPNAIDNREEFDKFINSVNEFIKD